MSFSQLALNERQIAKALIDKQDRGKLPNSRLRVRLRTHAGSIPSLSFTATLKRCLQPM
jgi:hypothetical protein